MFYMNPHELFILVEDVARKLGTCDSGSIFDSNGNKVGEWGHEKAEEEESEEIKFRMHYTCPNDGETWEMEWSCACNDRCPKCRAEIEPDDVEDINL